MCPAGGAYLNYVSLLNQAVMMSTQLYNDATNPAHHKYAAHQVALLYVSTVASTDSTRQTSAAAAHCNINPRHAVRRNEKHMQQTGYDVTERQHSASTQVLPVHKSCSKHHVSAAD